MTREDLPAEEDLDAATDADADADADDLSNPNHPDHDLSEWSPYTTPFESKPWFIRRWAVIVVSVLVILGLIIPFLPR